MRTQGKSVEGAAEQEGNGHGEARERKRGMRGTGAAEAEGAGNRPGKHRSSTRGTLARELD